jgi:hypothetical protein
MKMYATITNHDITGLTYKLSAGLIIAISIFSLQAEPAFADKGTIKVQNCTKEHGHVSHVDLSRCPASIAGTKFESNSTGTWTVKSIAPTRSGKTTSGRYSATSKGTFTETLANLPNGHYKITVSPDGANGCGKHKVIWVRNDPAKPIIPVALTPVIGTPAPVLSTMPLTGPAESQVVSLVTASLGLFFRRLQKLFR